jgi:hypothetical protein
VFVRRVSAALRAHLLAVAPVALALCLAWCASGPVAHAQQVPQPAVSAPVPVEEAGQWFVGAYYRHAWVPTFALKPIFERAASISNEGLGLVVSHSSPGGTTLQIGLGYQGYHFAGAFNPNNALIEDTEWVVSKLGLVHLTGSVLWPFKLHRMWTLELGLGLDLGIVTGKLHRTEAYPRNGAFQPCEAALEPDVTGPNNDSQGMPLAYCEQPYDRNGQPTDTSGATISGAHYNDHETRVPPIMLVPMLPHFAVRFEPSTRIAIKLEAAFGIAQLWVGASVHLGFGGGSDSTPAAPPPDVEHEAPPQDVPLPAVVPVPEPAATVGNGHKLGRVIGKLMEENTSKPIAHGSVKNRRMFSAIQTDSAGLFVLENLEPGPLRLDVSHPDYEAGGCDANIPPQGGDLNVHCFLRPGRREGAISGQVKDADGKTIAGARVEIIGPVSTVSQSDASGLFALVDAPEGIYRIRVSAPGYLLQMIEVELSARETELPQVILLKSNEVKP